MCADETTQSEAVGERLKFLRRRLGISQRELARRAGIPNGNLSLIEQGKVSPSVASLAKILNAVNLSLKDFFALACDHSDPRIPADDFAMVSHQGQSWQLTQFNYPQAAVTLIRSSIAPGAEVAAPPGVEARHWVGVLASGEVELVCNGSGYPLQAGGVVELASVSDVRLVNQSAVAALFVWFAVG